MQTSTKNKKNPLTMPFLAWLVGFCFGGGEFERTFLTTFDENYESGENMDYKKLPRTEFESVPIISSVALGRWCLLNDKWE